MIFDIGDCYCYSSPHYREVGIITDIYMTNGYAEYCLTNKKTSTYGDQYDWSIRTDDIIYKYLKKISKDDYLMEML